MIDAFPFRVVAVQAEPLSVPLREPFVIATARMEVTRAALVRVRVERGGCAIEGLGEAAALWPVTREDQPELLRRVGAAPLPEGPLGDRAALSAWLDRAADGSPVVRAGLETAVLDALARAAAMPLAAMLSEGASTPIAMTTDVTLPIAPPDRMAAGARAWRARGFDRFKVKVGRAWREDRDALRAVHAAVPDARFRLDANEGFSAREALALLDDARAAGLSIECFEQPCRRDDPEGMAEVTAHAGVPVVADESLRSEADLDAILARRTATAVNLKLCKLGGPLAALQVGRRARREGLGVMAGAMVETSLGLTAMAHVITALGGVDWVDLDTALLLAEDPFVGGMRMRGPRIDLVASAGLGCVLRPPASA